MKAEAPGVSALLASMHQWALFRQPLVISQDTCAFALAVVGAAVLFPALLVRR